MASLFAEDAVEAFMNNDYELAIDLFFNGIDLDSCNADYSDGRAEAYIKVQKFTQAVADANKTIESDPSIIKAYLRKGTACMKLEEYQTAKEALELGSSYAPGDQRFSNLITECDKRIAEESAEQLKFAILAAVSSAKPKYRHEHYQEAEEVVLTIFAKGIAADNVIVEFGEQTLSVTIHVPGEEPYHFQPRLFGKIVPEKCRYEVLSTEIEIHLAKVEPINWTSFDYPKNCTFIPDGYSAAMLDQCAEVSPQIQMGALLSTDWIDESSKKIEDNPSRPVLFDRGNCVVSLPQEGRDRRRRDSRLEGVTSSTTKAPPGHHNVRGVKD